MAGVLLALFPLLLMFNTRVAWVVLGTQRHEEVEASSFAT